MTVPFATSAFTAAISNTSCDTERSGNDPTVAGVHTPIPAPPAADPLKLALGERLFSDKRLSASGALACSSCHDIRSNGARPNDGTVSRPFDTPTVFNAVLSFRLNWEGNFRSPAAQLV